MKMEINSGIVLNKHSTGTKSKYKREIFGRNIKYFERINSFKILDVFCIIKTRFYKYVPSVDEKKLKKTV